MGKKGKKSTKKATGGGGGAAAAGGGGAAAVKKAEFSSKDRKLLNSLAKKYDQKQFKAGLKAADQVLHNNPGHGETLCWRALMLSGLKSSEDVVGIAKEGLRADMGNHKCWHLLGLVHRGRGEYREALQAYRGALRCGGNESSIRRDMSVLLLQVDDMRGVSETAELMLAEGRGMVGSAWSSFVASQHLLGNTELAVETMRAFAVTKKQGGLNAETDDLWLFAVQAWLERECWSAALRAADEGVGKVRGVTSLLSMRATALYRLGRVEESAGAYRRLLESSPENLEWHVGLQASVLGRAPPVWSLSRRSVVPFAPGTTVADVEESRTPLSVSEREKLVAEYAELQKRFPRCRTARRLPLSFLVEEEGSGGGRVEVPRELEVYVRQGLRKGIPSLFEDVQPLYAVLPKALDAVTGRAVDQLSGTGRWEMVDGDRAPVERESPATLLWALVLRARHLEHVGDLDAALHMASRAVEHTPTSPEALMLRAQLESRSGAFRLAAETLRAARMADEHDRFVTSKFAKALLRCGDIDEARTVESFFHTKEDDPHRHLLMVQTLWFELELAEALERDGQLGKALKVFLEVQAQIDTMGGDDTFDYHGYLLRRTQVRMWLSLARWRRRVRRLRSYVRATLGVARVLEKLHDQHKWPQKDADDFSPEELEAMPTDERKKLRDRARARRSKQRKLVEEARTKIGSGFQSRITKEALEEPEPSKRFARCLTLSTADPDPEGEELMRSLGFDPLSLAANNIRNAADAFEPNEDARREHLARAITSKSTSSSATTTTKSTSTSFSATTTKSTSFSATTTKSTTSSSSSPELERWMANADEADDELQTVLHCEDVRLSLRLHRPIAAVRAFQRAHAASQRSSQSTVATLVHVASVRIALYRPDDAAHPVAEPILRALATAKAAHPMLQTASLETLLAHIDTIVKSSSPETALLHLDALRDLPQAQEALQHILQTVAQNCTRLADAKPTTPPRLPALIASKLAHSDQVRQAFAQRYPLADILKK